MSRPLPAVSRRTGWARGGRSFSCTASMRPERAWSSRPWRHGWPSNAGWCWSTGSASAPRIGPTRPTAGRSTGSSSSASGRPPCSQARPRSTSSRSPCPGQYVVVAAADHPERFGRIVLISPTGFGRFKGSAGRTSRTLYRSLRLTGIGRLLFAVLARRQVIRWFLRQTFADPERVPRGVRAVLLADLPAAGRLPGAAGVRLRAAQRSPGGGGLRAAREPDAPRLR